MSNQTNLSRIIDQSMHQFSASFWIGTDVWIFGANFDDFSTFSSAWSDNLLVRTHSGRILACFGAQNALKTSWNSEKSKIQTSGCKCCKPWPMIELIRCSDSPSSSRKVRKVARSELEKYDIVADIWKSEILGWFSIPKSEFPGFSSHLEGQNRVYSKQFISDLLILGTF